MRDLSDTPGLTSITKSYISILSVLYSKKSDLQNLLLSAEFEKLAEKKWAHKCHHCGEFAGHVKQSFRIKRFFSGNFFLCILWPKQGE